MTIIQMIHKKPDYKEFVFRKGREYENHKFISADKEKYFE